MMSEHRQQAQQHTSSGGVVRVQVIYATPAQVWERTLSLPAGSSVSSALKACGFAETFPDYPLAELAVGIYGQSCSIDRILHEGDRVEIYRKLSFDPMESRRRRAAHRQAFMTKPRNRPKRRKAKLAEQQRESK